MSYIEQLKEWNACPDGYKWAIQNKIKSTEDVWDKCERADWLLWLIQKTGRIDEKRMIIITALIAETVLHIYEEKFPDDSRVRECIQAIKDYANGKITKEKLKTYQVIAHAAYTAYIAVAYADAAAYVAYTAAYAAYIAVAYADGGYGGYIAADGGYIAAIAADAVTYTAKKSQHKKMIAIVKQNIKLSELS